MTTTTAAFPISVCSPPSDLGVALQRHTYSAVRPSAHTVSQRERDYAPSKSNFHKLQRSGCLHKENRRTDCLIHALTVFFFSARLGKKITQPFLGFCERFGSHRSHKLMLLLGRTFGPLVFCINAAFIGRHEWTQRFGTSLVSWSTLDPRSLQAVSSVTLSSSFWPVDERSPLPGIRVGD